MRKLVLSIVFAIILKDSILPRLKCRSLTQLIPDVDTLYKGLFFLIYSDFLVVSNDAEPFLFYRERLTTTSVLIQNKTENLLKDL